MNDPLLILLAYALILGALILLLLLAYVPGMVARKRGHPSAQAISICGVLGLLIWPLWVVAYIWAYTGPDLSKAPPAAHPEPRPAPRGLACDSCGRMMTIAEARQIGTRLICQECVAALDTAKFAPKAEQLFDPSEDLQRLAAQSRRDRRRAQ